MNPHLDKLQSYPFEKLRQLFAGSAPNPEYKPISLGMGEPKHPTPAFIRQALIDNLDGLASYPLTAGSEALRHAIASWLERRYGLPALDRATQVLPINGSREALFALAQTVIAPDTGALVMCPNPFYQIYEGAAFLAGGGLLHDEVAEEGQGGEGAGAPEEAFDGGVHRERPLTRS